LQAAYKAAGQTNVGILSRVRESMENKGELLQFRVQKSPNQLIDFGKVDLGKNGSIS